MSSLMFRRDSAHGVGLEPLAHLVEEHDGHRLGVVPAALVQGQGDGAHGGHRHEEVLVEHLAVPDAPGRLPQDVVADHQVGDHVAARTGATRSPARSAGRSAGPRHQDAGQHLFLLVVHSRHLAKTI